MKRRNWLQLSAGAVLGSAQLPLRADTALVPLSAGPFSVKVPAEWAKTALTEKVPLLPLYTTEEWQAVKKDASLQKKPAYLIRPQHWALRFPAVLPAGTDYDPQVAGDDAEAPQILIHKAAEWAVAFTNGEESTTEPGALLQKLRQQIEGELTGEEASFSPAYMDATLSFTCLKKKLNFTGGHGVRLLAQWTIEADLLRQGGLHYLFVGMSKDSSCQILATFPLTLPGLPGPNGTTHLGRSTEPHEALTKNFQTYENDARKWLAEHVGEITPKLETLDEVISSLVVRTWQ